MGSVPRGSMDFRDRLAVALHELQVVLISIEDWVLIQRESFDIHIDEEPYHALQIYANISKGKYIIRVWGSSVKSGEFLTIEELTTLCTSSFGRTVSCLGYLGADPGGLSLVQVKHPCPRWISKSCAITFDKNRSGLIVGLCSACSGSGERLNGEVSGGKPDVRPQLTTKLKRVPQISDIRSLASSPDVLPDPIQSPDWPEKRKHSPTEYKVGKEMPSSPKQTFRHFFLIQERKRQKPDLQVKKEVESSQHVTTSLNGTSDKLEKVKQDKEVLLKS